MSKKELLLSEIDQVPEPFLDELLDFVPFPFSDLTQSKRRPALVISIER